MPNPTVQRIFHSFALLVSLALCGSILGGVVGSLLVDPLNLDAANSVLGGIGIGGGAGLVTGAAIAMRSSIETLKRYSRIWMILAVLFMLMLLLRRYRMEQQLREDSIEVIPV